MPELPVQQESSEALKVVIQELGQSRPLAIVLKEKAVLDLQENSLALDTGVVGYD